MWPRHQARNRLCVGGWWSLLFNSNIERVKQYIGAPHPFREGRRRGNSNTRGCIRRRKVRIMNNISGSQPPHTFKLASLQSKQCHMTHGIQNEECVREELTEKKCLAELLCKREALKFYYEPLPRREGVVHHHRRRREVVAARWWNYLHSPKMNWCYRTL